MEENSSAEAKKRGINIQDALSILDSRPKCGGGHDLKIDETTSKDEIEQKKSMGQTIDLFAWTNMKQDSFDCIAPSTGKKKSVDEESELLKDALENQKKIDAVRKEREIELRSKLVELSVRDLVKAVLEAQQERIATYKRFDEGLERVIITGNITAYPSVCAHATAAFSVLSETMNTISQILLENHKRKDLRKIIKDLQTNEKEKLNTTAALHLERIRKKNEDTDETITKLFRESILSLRAKLGELIIKINDILEELRYEVLDE